MKRVFLLKLVVILCWVSFSVLGTQGLICDSVVAPLSNYTYAFTCSAAFSCNGGAMPTCGAGTCSLTCTGTINCGGTFNCPDGFDCYLKCLGPSSCTGLTFNCPGNDANCYADINTNAALAINTKSTSQNFQAVVTGTGVKTLNCNSKGTCLVSAVNGGMLITGSNVVDASSPTRKIFMDVQSLPVGLSVSLLCGVSLQCGILNSFLGVNTISLACQSTQYCQFSSPSGVSSSSSVVCLITNPAPLICAQAQIISNLCSPTSNAVCGNICNATIPSVTPSNSFSSSITPSLSLTSSISLTTSLTSSTSPSLSPSTTPNFCGNGQLDPFEQCDPLIYPNITGLDLLFCFPESCTWNKDPEDCSLISSDYEIRRITRLVDLYLLRASNDIQGGVVNSLSGQWVENNGTIRVSGLVASAVNNTENFWMMNVGNCTNKIPEDPNLIVSIDLNTVSQPIPLFDCCNQTFCTEKILDMSNDYCSTFGFCNETELYNIGTNLTYLGHTYSMVNISESPSCFNFTSQQVQDYKILGRQYLCCAANVFRTINDKCSYGFHWDMNTTNPSVFTTMTDSDPSGGFIESDFGYETLTYEDHAPDHDNNDAVLRHREVCAYIFVNSTFSPAISCYSYLNNVARGGGYDNQIYLALNGLVNPPSWPTPPQTPCVLYDYLAPIPPNQFLPGFDLFLSFSELYPGPGEWTSMNGVLGIFYLIQPGQNIDNLNLTSTFKCTYDFSDPFLLLDPPNQLCGTTTGIANYLIYPDLKTNLPSGLPMGEENYPNTMNSSQPSIKNTYNVIMEWGYLHPYQSYYINMSKVFEKAIPVQDNGVNGTGIPRLRYYLNNLSCDKQIDLADIDPQFVDDSLIPWAFAVPKSLWCWALEGIPLYMPDNMTGQCVFGQNTGKTCSVIDNQCPFSFCVIGSGTCYGSLDPCDAISQCPYGRDCYTRNNYCDVGTPLPCEHLAGSYPYVFNYQQCLDLGCYNENPDPSCLVSPFDCYAESTMHWYFYPNVNINMHLYIPSPFV